MEKTKESNRIMYMLIEDYNDYSLQRAEAVFDTENGIERLLSPEWYKGVLYAISNHIYFMAMTFGYHVLHAVEQYEYMHEIDGLDLAILKYDRLYII